MITPEQHELMLNVPMWAVAQELGLGGGNQRGDEYDFLCLWHDDSNPSFQIYRAANGEWMGTCQSCKVSVNIFGLVQKLTACTPADALEKVKKLGEKYETKPTIFRPIADSGNGLSFPVDRLTPVEDALSSSGLGAAWLKERGISLETAKQLHWGFVQHPPVDALSEDHEWFDKGWIVFPVISKGIVVSIKYRSVMGKMSPKGDRGFARKPGMMTPPPMDGLDCIDPKEPLVIVEGEPDMAVMWQAGFLAASISSASGNPSAEDKNALKRSKTRFLAGDMDPVGQVAMVKIWKELKNSTYLIEWPKDSEGRQYKDANEVFLKACNGDVNVFRALVLELMKRAKQRPSPTVWSLTDILKNLSFQSLKEDPRALYWPWDNVHKWTTVLPGELMLLFGSEPKVGKSTFLMNVLIENAIRGKTILYYSAETTAKKYAAMVASYLTHQSRTDIQSEHAQAAAQLIEDVRFYIGYKPGATFKQVMEILKEESKNLGADIVVIDPIHFLIRGAKDENAAMAEASRNLTDFSIENDVIMIAVGQPRKAQANQRGRKAETSDLRGSASLGEDAASVWILHRDRKKKVQEGESIYEPITTLTLDYSRNSDTTSTQLYFHGDTCRFTPLHAEQDLE